jgi:hypothetical protein
MKKFLFIHIGYGLLMLPDLALAQGNGQNARTLTAYLSRLINQQLIPLFIAMALAYTIYSVVMFIAADSESQKREEKKQQIFWGIIGLFVIVSIWGLVAVISNSFDIFAGGTLKV